MYTLVQSISDRPVHSSPKISGGGVSALAAPASKLFIAASVPKGSIVKINGKKATVNKTMRFLNTSAHSLATIVFILSMSFSFLAF
jgi:hypothetical protein